MAEDTPKIQGSQSLQELLQNTNPSWLKDGLGVRGNPVTSDMYSGSNGGHTTGGRASSTPESQQFDYGASYKTAPIPDPFSPSSAGATISFPFQATLFSDPRSSQDYVTINDESDLMLSYAPDTTMSITGLGSRIPVDIGHNIWLEMAITDLLVTSASIKSSSSGSFDLSARVILPGAFVEFNTDRVQTKAKKLIAKVDTDSKGNTKVYQYVFNHLVMQSMCIDGLPCIYPAPY